MAFQTPHFKRYMASAAQDQRGTFSDHLRLVFGTSPASPETERDGDIAGGTERRCMSIFEEAAREADRCNCIAEERMAAEAAGMYEDHSEFCTHRDAQLDVLNYDNYNYDISDEIADNQDIPAGPNTPMDERLETMEEEMSQSRSTREQNVYEAQLDMETQQLRNLLNAEEAQGAQQAETPDIPASRTPSVSDPMEEGEDQGTRSSAMDVQQPETSPAPTSPPSIMDPNIVPQFQWIGMGNSAMHSTIAAFATTATEPTYFSRNPFASLSAPRKKAPSSSSVSKLGGIGSLSSSGSPGCCCGGRL